VSHAIPIEVRANPKPVDAGERARRLESPGFGRYFTDHMVMIDHAPQRGWGPASVESYGPLTLDPASSVLH
jgi:branched-chain amino acid aminotransferase